MSQIVDMGPSFIFVTKNGKVSLLFHNYFSRFHKRKTRIYIKKSEKWFPTTECFLWVRKISGLGN